MIINISFRVILVTRQISRKIRLPAAQWNQLPSAANDNPLHTVAYHQPNPPLPAETSRRPRPPIAAETSHRLLPPKSYNTHNQKSPPLPAANNGIYRQPQLTAIHHALPPATKLIHRRLPKPAARSLRNKP